jgi:hypothetical protein
MTPLGKVIFGTLSVAVLVAATLALREKPAPTVSHAQLTPSQLAEMSAPTRAPEPPKAASPRDGAGETADPPDPEIEDGSGS